MTTSPESTKQPCGSWLGTATCALTAGHDGDHMTEPGMDQVRWRQSPQPTKTAFATDPDAGRTEKTGADSLITALTTASVALGVARGKLHDDACGIDLCAGCLVDSAADDALLALRPDLSREDLPSLREAAEYQPPREPR